MNEVDTPTENLGQRWFGPTNCVLVLAGIAVLSGYTILLRRLPLLDMGPFSFRFFPIPWFTATGEFLFILLLTILAMWHIKLAWTRPRASGWRERWSKMSQLAFAMVLLLIPLLFRAAAEFLLEQING
ncbi:MAG: hypothetical protein MK108_04115 [Mariniblastus sp.]|nr:hypothetical protein [Mariniblastus sp.]